MQLILASKSPRRKQLLGQIGLTFDVIRPVLDESLYFPGEKPVEYCMELARLKALSVANTSPGALTIGADTIVLLNGEILEKPADMAEAGAMLERLSGHTHQVYTGVSLQSPDMKVDCTFSEKTDVTFRKIDKNEIRHYIENFAPFDKAGSYGIQDFSAVFVSRICGCYNNVVGFPIYKFYKTVKDLTLKLEFHSKFPHRSL
ncbi:MAG: septum formation protein Maf [FCB group bacterium]|nr:septum formation protein Maf [FCB group bacterium]